jgi:peroxiredoxin family protein/DNA-binding MarR family transcriptional regulator
MNEKTFAIKEDLLTYQAHRLQELIVEMLKCCEDRKVYESGKFALPHAELKCLLLFDGQRYLTVKDIAQKLEVAKSRVTKLVNGLKEKRLVEEIDDPKDARIKLISLTPAGHTRFNEIAAFQKNDLETQFAELKSKVETLTKESAENKLSMIVFSGDMDKVLAALIIASGAVAMGMDVVMFFTFWGTPILRDKGKKVGGKDLMGTMFGAMLPKGACNLKLSKMNMGGMGTAMMKSLMKKKNVASVEEMLAVAGELGVKIYVCEMSMDLMGFKREEMIEYPKMDFCGVAKFLEEAKSSKIQLFI